MLVDGEVVVEGGKLVHADETTLTDGAEAAAQAAWSRFVAKYGDIIAPH